MFKKISVVLLAAAITMSSMVVQAQAQDEESAEADKVRQGELAQLLVNVLGLYRFLPAAPSEQEAIGVLLANQIAPEEGWEPAKEVTRADLARVIVLALDRAAEVEDPDEPESWISFLSNQGVPIDTIGLSLTNLEPLPEPIAGNVFAASITTDPLRKRTVFGLPDELETGTDVSFVPSQVLTLEDVVEIIEQVPSVPPRPTSPTPD